MWQQEQLLCQGSQSVIMLLTYGKHRSHYSFRKHIGMAWVKSVLTKARHTIFWESRSLARLATW